MSTTVTYKGNTITTVNNNTKTLTTAGKYLEANVILTDITGQSSSSGYTRTVVAPQQTVTSAYSRTETVDGYFAEITITEPLEEWSDYIVTLDDDEYYTTGILMWGVDISLGIESYFWDETSGTSRSIPFGILYESGSTCTMAVNSARTMSVKIEKIELTGSGGGGGSATLITKTITANGTYSAEDDNADGYSEVTVNLPVTWETKTDQDITISFDGTYNYSFWTYTEPLQANETYRITWGENGTQYICQTVAESTGGTYDGYFLGNASIVNLGENTGEPFLLYRNSSTRMIVTTTQSTGSWHIKVEKQVQISATLTTKTITENGTYTALNDSADGYSKVVVNVSSGSETTYDNIVPLQTINCTIELANGAYGGYINPYTSFTEEGEKYRVIFDGTTYEPLTATYYGSGTAYLYVGDSNVEASSSATLVYPFEVMLYNGQNFYFAVKGSGSHTLQVDKIVSSGSGSSEATLVTKTITTNGTYDAEDDSADGYSSVTVSVTPNLQSKSATPTTSSQTISSDSGYDGLSSVTVGAIPSQYIVPTGSLNITTNNTYDVTNYASAVVNVPSGWTKVAETSYQVNTTGTSATTVATWATGHSEIWTSDKIVYVRVRDTAGKRNGYFYGTDTFFLNMYPVNNSSSTSNNSGNIISTFWAYANQGAYVCRYGYSTTGYGVYPDYFYNDGRIRIRSRYNSSYSLTINGTYKVEVYLLNPPTSAPIFT